jgi:hypothetical protein
MGAAEPGVVSGGGCGGRGAAGVAGPGAGRARRGRGGPGEVRARRARRRRPTPAARPRSAGQNSRGSRGRPIPRRSSRDGGDGDVHDRATVMFAKRARQYDVRRACYMTTTSVRCTPTLESISRMIHCEDVSVKFARRVEAILADPEILEAPSALHLAAFYGGYAFAVPGVGWIPGAVDAHVGVSGNSMRSWHHVYMRLRGRDGLVQVAKAILAVVLNGPRDPEASQGNTGVPVAAGACRSNSRTSVATTEGRHVPGRADSRLAIQLHAWRKGRGRGLLSWAGRTPEPSVHSIRTMAAGPLRVPGMPRGTEFSESTVALG